jgi:hypothetical protein
MRGVDYTDEEFPYDFDPDKWVNFGFLQLRHFPILSIQRAQLVGPTTVLILNLLDWQRTNKRNGQLHFYPRNQLIFGPPLGGYGSVLLWQIRRYPQGLEIDYEAGYENADKLDSGLRDVIGKWASIKALIMIGGGILPTGQASQNVGLDGLSESISFTQTASTTTFAARIKQYSDDIATWLTKNRYKYSNIPMGFVEGS